MTTSSLNEAYWNDRYLDKDTSWDIGHISTPLKEYIDQLTDKNISILIPGCGNSYEAAYLLDQGFTDVTLIDIAPTLTAKLEASFAAHIPHRLHVITGDFFTLVGQYDLILEQTFFCALEPSLRPLYVQQMSRLLKPGGKLAGVLFDRSFAGGPPFSGSIAEYEVVFATYFALPVLAPCYNSIKPRAGAEAFIIAKKLA